MATGSDGIHLSLTGELTIHTAAATHAALADALASSPLVTIALDGVTDFDTAGLQLLLGARRDPHAAARITSMSPSVARVIELANVGHLLAIAPDDATPSFA